MQGYRINMEDAHILQCKLSDKNPNAGLFAVFDGHGGENASIFMSKRLTEEVAKLDDPHSHAALTRVVADLDKEFLMTDDKENGSTCLFAVVEQVSGGAAAPAASPKKKKSGAKKKKKTKSISGTLDLKTTKRFKITIANVGDSRAILLKADGKSISLTNDHKPDNELEKERIQAAGGFVRASRVDGQLAMSRAIGDYQYKSNPSLTPTNQKVICTPEFSTAEAAPGDVLLLFCDGIVEQLTNEEVSAYVYEKLPERKDALDVLSGLMDLSLEKGSKDNMSVMAIFFEDGTSYNEEKDVFVPGPFTANKNDNSFQKAYLEDAAKHGYSGKVLEDMIEEVESKLPVRPVAGPSRPEESNDALQTILQSLASNLGVPGSDQEKRALLYSLIQNGNIVLGDEEEDIEAGGGDGEDGHMDTSE